MLRVHQEMTLRSPLMLAAFSGWPDASLAATGALKYLRAKYEVTRLAELDPEAIFCYSVTRPITSMLDRGRRAFRYPELVIYGVPLPFAERDVVLVTGPEPDLLWRASCGTIADYAGQVGVQHVVTFGAFYAQVPHNLRPPVFGRSADAAERARLASLGIQDTSYEGPTGFPTALADATQQRGIPSTGLWAAGPIYLQGGTNPKVALRLLRVVERMYGVELGLGELRGASQDLDRRIDEALHARPDLERFVQRMAGGGEPVIDSSESPDDLDEAELPSPAEFLQSLEEYLRESRPRETDEQ
jgi:PAC2 family protein